MPQSQRTKITRTKGGFTVNFSKRAGQAFAESIRDKPSQPLLNRIVDAVRKEATS